MPMVPVEPDSVHPLVTLGPTRTARNRCPLRAFRPIRMPLACTPFGAGRLSTPWSMSWSKAFGGVSHARRTRPRTGGSATSRPWPLNLMASLQMAWLPVTCIRNGNSHARRTEPMKTVIAEILPFAIVVAVSPINIVAAILLMFSKKPVLNASCYLAGFMTGVALVLAAVTVIADSAGLSGDAQRSRWASALLVALGVYLLFVAVQTFRKRPAPDENPPAPAWMDGITGFGPLKSIGIGLTIGALNPKNIAVAVAAAITIASAGLTPGTTISVVAIYTVIASLGVAAPIVTTLILGDRSTEVLEDWKAWLDRNTAAVMAVIYLIFGVILVGKGIGGI